VLVPARVVFSVVNSDTLRAVEPNASPQGSATCVGPVEEPSAGFEDTYQPTSANARPQDLWYGCERFCGENPLSSYVSSSSQSTDGTHSGKAVVAIPARVAAPLDEASPPSLIFSPISLPRSSKNERALESTAQGSMPVISWSEAYNADAAGAAHSQGCKDQLCAVDVAYSPIVDLTHTEVPEREKYRSPSSSPPSPIGDWPTEAQLSQSSCNKSQADGYSSDVMMSCEVLERIDTSVQASPCSKLVTDQRNHQNSSDEDEPPFIPKRRQIQHEPRREASGSAQQSTASPKPMSRTTMDPQCNDATEAVDEEQARYSGGAEDGLRPRMRTQQAAMLTEIDDTESTSSTSKKCSGRAKYAGNNLSRPLQGGESTVAVNTLDKSAPSQNTYKRSKKRRIDVHETDQDDRIERSPRLHKKPLVSHVLRPTEPADGSMNRLCSANPVPASRKSLSHSGPLVLR
jgi:hypothetical protein